LAAAVKVHALDHDAEALETQQQALTSAVGALGLTRQGYRVGNADILQARTRKLTDAVGLVNAFSSRNPCNLL
jgi:outer membrane protein TolC